MNLQEKINADLKEALKSQDENLRSVLRLLITVIKNKEIEKKGKLAKEGAPQEKIAELSRLNEEEIIESIISEIKKRKEAAEQYQRGGREDLVRQERQELNILSRYLPQQLSEEQIRSMVQEAIIKLKAGGPEDLGKIMNFLMPQIKGRAEGGLINKIVREELNK